MFFDPTKVLIYKQCCEGSSRLNGRITSRLHEACMVPCNAMIAVIEGAYDVKLAYPHVPRRG